MVAVGRGCVQGSPAVAVRLVDVGPVDVEQADQHQVVVQDGLEEGSKSAGDF